MVAIAVLCALAVSLQAPPRIELRGGEFVIAWGPKSVRVPAKPVTEPDAPSTPPFGERAAFRKDEAHAVWDARGLTLRKGQRVRTTRLAEIALSPRLFSSNEIVHSRLLMAAELRLPWAGGADGARRIGDFVYFLARWEEFGGNPWLQALVRVVLSDASLRPELLTRVQGRVFRPQGSDNALLIVGGRPAWIEIRQGGEWGVCSWVETDSRLEWKRLGRDLVEIQMRSSNLASFLQSTGHGSLVLGRADLRLGATRLLLETRGSARLMDGSAPWIAVVHDETGAWLHNLESGAKLRLPEPAGFRRTEAGVLVWTPDEQPTLATLHEVERFERLATWSGRPGGRRDRAR